LFFRRSCTEKIRREDKTRSRLEFSWKITWISTAICPRKFGAELHPRNLLLFFADGPSSRLTQVARVECHEAAHKRNQARIVDETCATTNLNGALIVARRMNCLPAGSAEPVIAQHVLVDLFLSCPTRFSSQQYKESPVIRKSSGRRRAARAMKKPEYFLFRENCAGSDAAYGADRLFDCFSQTSKRLDPIVRMSLKVQVSACPRRAASVQPTRQRCWTRFGCADGAC